MRERVESHLGLNTSGEHETRCLGVLSLGLVSRLDETHLLLSQA